MATQEELRPSERYRHQEKEMEEPEYLFRCWPESVPPGWASAERDQMTKEEFYGKNNEWTQYERIEKSKRTDLELGQEDFDEKIRKETKLKIAENATSREGFIDYAKVDLPPRYGFEKCELRFITGRKCFKHLVKDRDGKEGKTVPEAKYHWAWFMDNSPRGMTCEHFRGKHTLMKGDTQESSRKPDENDACMEILITHPPAEWVLKQHPDDPKGTVAGYAATDIVLEGPCVMCDKKLCKDLDITFMEDNQMIFSQKRGKEVLYMQKIISRDRMLEEVDVKLEVELEEQREMHNKLGRPVTKSPNPYNKQLTFLEKVSAKMEKRCLEQFSEKEQIELTSKENKRALNFEKRMWKTKDALQPRQYMPRDGRSYHPPIVVNGGLYVPRELLKYWSVGISPQHFINPANIQPIDDSEWRILHEDHVDVFIEQTHQIKRWLAAKKAMKEEEEKAKKKKKEKRKAAGKQIESDDDKEESDSSEFEDYNDADLCLDYFP